MEKTNVVRAFCITSLMSVLSCFGLSQEARDKGFVYLDEVDPTIQVSLRYYGNENFLGRTVNGYTVPKLVMTKQAAKALKKVQKAVKKDGYSLLVYDAYRPQRAVDNFMSWSLDVNDQVRKVQYYPRVDKARVFELGYVAERSGHSRGSTVDLTLIKDGKKVQDIIETKRTLLDGFTIAYLDDGSVDMGSSFDLFDLASHFENMLIEEPYKTLRTYLQKVMMNAGFKPYAEEWWHFTLANEPYPANHDSSYFNFPIEYGMAFTHSPYLETERLIVRRLTPDDVQDCFAITSDPRVLAMMVVTELHTTIEQTKQYIADILAQYEKDNADLWAVVEKSSNKMIGVCGLIEYKERFRRAELGFMLAYDAWGKGYATESSKAIVDYGFTAMNLNRIEASVDPENIASIRVLEKLGMQREGLLRQRVICNGRPRDRAMYGLLKEEPIP